VRSHGGMREEARLQWVIDKMDGERMKVVRTTDVRNLD